MPAVGGPRTARQQRGPVPAECGGGFVTGSWQVRVWLEDEAGNQDPNASASVTEAPPAVASARSTLVRTSCAAPPATGKVALRVTPQRGRETWPARRATRAIRDGRAVWTLRVPHRATRVSVVAAYTGAEGFGARTKRGGVRLTR